MEFISIAKLLDAISQRIELPENWDELIGLGPVPTDRPADESVELPQRIQNLNTRLIRSHLATDYTKSTAARGLDVVLVNHSELRPPWYDLKDTGAPKRNPSCQEEVEPILVFVANTFDRVQACLHRTGADWQPFHEAASAEYLRYDDAKRLREVGFYYHELKEFFGKVNIDNPFADELLEPEGRMEVEKSTPALQGRVHSTQGSRHDLLSIVIEEVIEDIQQDSTAAVFRALCLKAEREEHPFSKVVHDAVEYKDSDGEYKEFTRKALSSRLSRRKERLGTQ